MIAASMLPMLVGADTTSTDEVPLGFFGLDPWWLIVIKAVAIFIILVLLTLFNIWGERRVVARMQQRIGPNRVGPFGLLQGLMDGIKLALKEDIVPKAADKAVFIIAPLLAAIPAFLTWAVIPIGPRVSIFHHWTPLQLTDFPVAVLYVIAIASIGIYGIVLAGWSSGSTYPLLGGLRSSAQMISYEIPMGLSFVAVFLYTGSMSTSAIVDAQASGGTAHVFGHTWDLPSWYAIILFPSFVIYLVSMVGETNRAPFDLPEAEGELVGGFHTEYSSLKFAMFFLAEYINLVTVSALATTLFLGGWRAPWPISLWADANTGWWPVLWFFGKLLAFVFVFIWLRGTLPRMRYDQFMRIGWKVLIPVSLVWIVCAAGIRISRQQHLDTKPLLIAVVAVLIVLLALSVVFPGGSDTDDDDQADEVDPHGTIGGRVSEDTAPAVGWTGPASAQPGGFPGGYPVPPMPGKTQVDARPHATLTATTATTVLVDPADHDVEEEPSGD